MPRRRSPDTRRLILDRATDLASVEGLEGLSIGRLAEALEMSKSGVIGHFSSKEDLQLQTVEAARALFEAAVIDSQASRRAEHGRERLAALVESWIAYVASEVFAGGCFFWAASAEFDGRPGAVRDRVRALTQRWLETLEAEVRLAQRLGEVSDDEEPAQLAFELHAFVQEANWARQLLDRTDAFDRARRAVERRIAAAAPGALAANDA